MSEEIPRWAQEKARELSGHNKIACCAFDAFARYIASKEEPPVDPLLIEARKLVSETEPDVENARNIRCGMFDDGWRVILALAALKRGMELERGK